MNRNKPLSRSSWLRSGTGLPGGERARKAPLEQGGAVGRLTPLRAGAGKGPTREVRLLVLERDGYCCVCCGRSIIGERYSLAHRLRASQGGKAVPENLLVLLGLGAEQHHGRVDLYKDPADAVKGYRLKSGTDPLAVPVAYAAPDGLEWFFLLADGSRESVPAGQAGAA